MKFRKVSLLFAVLSLSFVPMVLPAKFVSAASDHALTLTIGYQDCKMTLNGNPGSVSTHITQSDNIVVTFANESNYPVGYQVTTVENPYEVVASGTVANSSGSTSVESFGNVQKSLILKPYFSGGEYCGVGTGNTAYIYVDQPVTNNPPASNNKPSSPPPAATPAPTTETNTTTVADTSASTVKLNAVIVAGKSIDITKPLQIEQSQLLVLEGQSTPDSTVTLTIHSTPKTVVVPTDAKGNWKYEVSNLAPGEHYIEVSSPDPATGKSTTPQTILTFKVVKADATATPKESNGSIVAIVGLVGTGVLAVVVVFIFRDKLKALVSKNKTE